MIAPNTSKRLLRAGFAVAAALALSGQSQNWVAEVERTEVSHIIGNPSARHTLTEFVSYTCGACGTFARLGEEVVKLSYVGMGRLRFEIRHIQRNEIDIALTMAAWCGGKDKFKQNHTAIMWSQDRWLPKAARPSPAQQTRWFTGAGPTKRKAILWDLDLYPLMESRGISRGELDACMSDDAFAERLVGAATADLARYGIDSTPSFALDDATLQGVHSWPELAPVLSKLATQAESPAEP